ncbi:aspartyl/asparaginyl beta-hydroxylase domain-containing protein [Thalassotalea sp. PLHSN55]|uniref:aspartyl/asparaginyl beta-hydroxylase domain-containing protein n=1 Tax=Thalassotalea sp. PLHSN55 TaxID=3435888 RepID=UPI003F8386B5
MYFNGQFKLLGKCDIAELKTLVDSITTAQWQAHNERQKTFDVHSHTKTIPLIFDADFRHRFPTTLPALEQFQQALAPVMQTIVEHFKSITIITRGDRPNPVAKGYFVRLILVKLAPHSEIDEHTDNGFSLSRVHRIHLPIITNEHVEFTVDDVTKNLQAGELWEINNRGTHGVKNLSEQARVHFIFDFVIPGEVVEDPLSGTLFA